MNRAIRFSPVMAAGLILSFVLLPALVGTACAEEDGPAAMAEKISRSIMSSWTLWQDSLTVGEIEVEGGHGLLNPGDLRGEAFEGKAARAFGGQTERYSKETEVVLASISEALGGWIRGYSHSNVPFPRGASCTYTLTPCINIPVTLASGRSSGDSFMTEEALYNSMVYMHAEDDERSKRVYRGVSRGLQKAFKRWKRACFITDIEAHGGIAPGPAPIGVGPGPVRGATGTGGRVTGPYPDGDLIREAIVTAFGEEANGPEEYGA